ncbi:uncharacterized protein LOC126678472 [Mercurialis annua]|uniref:uncharacterized protein LOC126678472 n=1 Tax=Mercurialis annua TaxID=3986 RepID=UPI00216017BD|nr:uncharacterized protein LOC126678472 [Mercurialis annua]
MHSPDSLLHQIYKGKYFATTSILHAQPGTRPSWGWRSLCWGRDLLIQGLRWHINSGRSINCFNDPWVPTAFPFIPRCNPITTMPPISVYDLIDSTRRNWKSTWVLQLFHPEDAQKILEMALPYWEYEDKLIWHFTSTGQYTVKSGYYIALQTENQIQSSVPSFSKPDWKHLWNIAAPSKIKVFIWRCLHSGIPTAQALSNRLQFPAACKFCDMPETIMHLLFLCPRSQQVWFSSPLSFRPTWLTNQQFPEFWKSSIHSLLQLDPSGVAETTFCFLIWHIWKSRNNLIFKDQRDLFSEIISSSQKELQEFQESQNSLTRPTPPAKNQNVPQVSSLPSGSIKINYDAAVDKRNKRGFIGVIAMDCRGNALKKFSAFFSYIWDPGILEFLALRESMNWAFSLGWTNVVFEGDALQVSNTVNSRQCNIATYKGICDDIWHLQHTFNSAKIRFIPRQQNSAAHNWVQEVKFSFQE